MANGAKFLLILAVSMVFVSHGKGAPEFASDFLEAKKKARAEEKPLIVIFSATWCPPCQHMKRVVYPSSEITPFHEQFVWAYLDADLEANRALMHEYGVHGIPHIALHDSEGVVTSHLRGAMGADQLALELTEALTTSSLVEP